MHTRSTFSADCLYGSVFLGFASGNRGAAQHRPKPARGLSGEPPDLDADGFDGPRSAGQRNGPAQGRSARLSDGSGDLRASDAEIPGAGRAMLVVPYQALRVSVNSADHHQSVVLDLRPAGCVRRRRFRAINLRCSRIRSFWNKPATSIKSGRITRHVRLRTRARRPRLSHPAERDVGGLGMDTGSGRLLQGMISESGTQAAFLMKQRQWAEAIQLFSELLRDDPLDGETYQQRSLALSLRAIYGRPGRREKSDGMFAE